MAHIDAKSWIDKLHSDTHKEGKADEVDATTLKNAYASAIALGG